MKSYEEIRLMKLKTAYLFRHPHLWRVNFKIAGGHVHCGIFYREQGTFAKCGDIVVRRGPEFASFKRAFLGAEFIGEGDGIMAGCNGGKNRNE